MGGLQHLSRLSPLRLSPLRRSPWRRYQTLSVTTAAWHPGPHRSG
ncbi:hypothetical protein GJR88_04372 [Dietzia sp. DQ12-45-1b]|nr:hypothetical protein GJR88_04372 [Dietzia sp. DQ12-45-1b]